MIWKAINQLTNITSSKMEEGYFIPLKLKERMFLHLRPFLLTFISDVKSPAL